jgi:rod shape determining protein RodA
MTLSCLGLLFVFSATFKAAIPYSLFFKKQAFGIVSGIILYCVMCYVDYRAVQQISYILYFGIVGLLFLTIIKGSIGMGAQRWINIGIIKFQPSELAKLFFPGFFSYYLMTEKKHDLTLHTYGPIIIILIISTLLIRKQPDLGTALIILFTSSIMLWLSGLNKKFFIAAGILFLISAPITWTLLKPYQKKRIAVFLGEGERQKERYHIEQSKIAIGSGGLIGKGFLNGTQNKLQFLPESRTDFIFSVICEEWGFAGALLIIFLYLVLFARLFQQILTIKNFYAQLLASGLIIHIIISTLINIGMVMGLLPVVGIPLPLLSYGISNLWITYASLGCFSGIIITTKTLPT